MLRDFSTDALGTQDISASSQEEEDHAHLQWFDQCVAQPERSPKEGLLAWFSDCEQRIQNQGFAATRFLNAMAEIADREHPAYQSAAMHERVLRDRLAELSRQAGARDPEQLADQLLLVVNGALASASYVGEASPAHQLTTIAAHLIDRQVCAML